jgi:hypothetical protein
MGVPAPVFAPANGLQHRAARGRGTGNLRQSAEVIMARGHGDKYSRKREQAIAALLNCPSITSAAKSIGVSERTLRMWMKKPQFAADYRRARVAIVEHSFAQVQLLTGVVPTALKEVLKKGTPGERLRAISMIIGIAVKAVDTADTQARLEAMERGFADLVRERNAHDKIRPAPAHDETRADVRAAEDEPDADVEPDEASA